MTDVSAGADSGAIWRVWIGPLIWAAHFLAIYGFTALACARNIATESWSGVAIVTWFIGAATLLAAAVLLATIARAVRSGRRTRTAAESSRFVHWLTAAVASLALLAALWETLPVMLVPVCG